MTFLRIILFSFLSCSTLIAQQNRQKEFEKVLDYFKDNYNKEKLSSAEFLLKNITIHKSIDIKWVDNNDKVYAFSEFDYLDYKEAYADLFEKAEALGLKPKNKVTHDLQAITAKYLIDNINLSHEAWKDNSWASSYSFDNFKEFILPYRNLIEPLEDWREDYKEVAEEIICNADIDDTNDPVEVCSALVNGLNTMSFVKERIDPIPVLSPQQILFRKEGSCPDLANFSVYLCRSVGIAATFDFTPHYAASSNKHFWNTVINNEGEHIPFNSNAVNQSDESLPYVYNPNRKRLGKVYRKTFSIQKSALASKLSNSKIPAAFLKEKNILDVTSEYVAVTDLKIDARNFNDDIGYINVFNLGKWKTLGFGEKEGDKMVFKNLGRDVVYLPSSYQNDKMVNNKYPYLIDTKGNSKELAPKEILNTVTLSRDNQHKTDYRDFNTSEILDGEEYFLAFWEDKWKPIGKATAKNGNLTFTNVPSNVLYLLITKTPDSFERIFTIEEGTDKIFWY